MSLHPEIESLLADCKKKQSISILEKQVILNKTLEYNEDLGFVVSELEKIEQTANIKVTETSKCTACGELIPALDRVCPSCKNVESSKGSVDVKLDDLIFESERLLSSLKSSDYILFPKRLLKNSSISFPVFVGASFVLGWSFNSDVLAGVFFCSLLLWLFVVRKLKRNLLSIQNSQNQASFQVLIPQIENKIRLLELYFGNDNRTNDHLNQLKQELKSLKNGKNQLVIYEISIYFIFFILLFVIGYFTQI